MSKFKTDNYNLKFKSDVKIRAYKFSLDIIKTVASFPRKQVYIIIGNQLLRSSTSIGANIVEGKCSSSRKEFIKFYDISLKSANETLYWLSLLKDSRLVSEKEINLLLDECSQIAKLLASSLITLKGKR